MDEDSRLSSKALPRLKSKDRRLHPGCAGNRSLKMTSASPGMSVEGGTRLTRQLVRIANSFVPPQAQGTRISGISPQPSHSYSAVLTPGCSQNLPGMLLKFFYNHLYCYSMRVVPIFPPLPSSAHSTLHSHSQSPCYCPCLGY